MNGSTGLVLTAGALVIADKALTAKTVKPADFLEPAAATVLGALVAAGLDKVLPGLGTGLSALLAVAVGLKHVPSIFAHLPAAGGK